jgi:hypothetical protein
MIVVLLVVHSTILMVILSVLGEKKYVVGLTVPLIILNYLEKQLLFA